jgi:peptidyl-prolyl cis-trans isomerase A (cyclophilin A)
LKYTGRHLLPPRSPIGADRFYRLVLDNFYNCNACFRVVPGFVVQFGLASDPDETSKWGDIPIADDPPNVQSNIKGTVSFATSGPGSRTTQVFVNARDNAFLDDTFTPFARVTTGMEILTNMYNPTPEDDGGVSQGEIERQGNDWLLEKYPLIEIIESTMLTVPGEHDDNNDDSHNEDEPEGKPHGNNDESEMNHPTNDPFKQNGRLSGRRSWIAISVLIEIVLIVLLLRR